MTITELKSKYSAIRAEVVNNNEIVNVRKAELDAKIQKLQDEFAAENAELLSEQTRLATEYVDVESALRSAVIANYRATGNKTFDEHLSVRVTQTYKYDAEKAVEWAKVNAPILLTQTINKKDFEAIAKSKNLDFVELSETPSAVVSTKI